MVDVGNKPPSLRMARARTVVVLPKEVLAALTDGEIQTQKGAVFQTAIIAGVMAAKKTSELIPLCHPLGMDDCQVEIDLNEQQEVIIECITRVNARTGVEMEALTGATVAALTIYDMCKAFSHNILIKDTRLMEKRGGKEDFLRKEM